MRAANETRTRDPDLGKVVLYQLSYCRNFSVPEKLLRLSFAPRHKNKFFCSRLGDSCRKNFKDHCVPSVESGAKVRLFFYPPKVKALFL